MNRMQAPTARRFAGLLLAVAALGCSRVDHIVMEPKQPVLRTPAETVHMNAHCMTAHVEDAQAKVKWSVADPAIATVDDSGLVHGLSSGRTKVIATLQDLSIFGGKDISSSIPVEVLFVEKLTSQVPSVELSYEKGDGIDPHLAVLGYDGLPLKDRTVEYAVKDPAICRVDKSGQFWPNAVGETVVTASVGKHSVDIACVVTK